MTDFSWLAWPGAVVLLGGGALTMFRSNIGRLIDRTDKAKVPGVELSAPTPPQVAADPENPALPASIAPAMVPDSDRPGAGLPQTTPLILNVEASLIGELEARAPGDKATQQATTVRALAIARVLLAHEANYRVIFSTQLMLLKSINDRTVQNTAQALFWYDVFHKRVPDVPITFDEWLSFLENAGYVQIGDRVAGQPSSLTIDPFGRDFLLWMVHNGISELRPG